MTARGQDPTRTWWAGILALAPRLTPLALLCATACAPDAGSSGPYDPVTLELTTTEVTEPDVAVSPDGRSLVFTLVGHLFRVPIEGGEAEQLTFGLGYDFDPVFSPDGAQLAFLSDRDDTDGNVFVLDLGTRTTQQVTREELGAARPAWSPDGSRIAYLGLVKPELPDRPWLSNTYQTVVRTTTLNDSGPVADVTPVGFFTSVLYLRDGRLAWASVTPDNRVEWVFGRVNGPAVTRIVTTHPDGTPDTLAVVAGMVHRLHHDPTAPGFIARQIPDPIPLGGGYEAEEVARIDGDASARLFDVTGSNGWDWGPGIAIDTARDRIVLGEEGRLLAIAIADPGDTVVIPFRARVRREAYPPVPPRHWTPPPRAGALPLEIPAAFPLPDGSGMLVVAAGHLWRLVEGEDASRLLEPSGWIQNMALSPDGDVAALVVGHDNLQVLHLHDIQQGTTREVSVGRRYGGLAWGRDGRTLTFRDGSSGPYVELDTRTGQAAELPDSTAAAERTATQAASDRFFYRGGRLYRVGAGAADTTEILADARFSFPPPPSVLIRRARVLDLEAGRFTDPTSVLVVDGRIRALGAEADRLVSEGVQTIPADGRYLVPGLFDLHVHHYGLLPESYVVFGVTSLREVGSGNGTLADSRIYADLGNFHAGPYPRNFHSGIIYGSPANVDDQPLAELREAGGSWAKAYATLPWSAQTRIAEDARAVGLPVAAHGLTRREVVKGISLGFASLEHIGWGPREDLLLLMKAADILWVPTLAVMAGISPGDPRPLDPFTSAAVEAFAWDTASHDTDENPHGPYDVRRAVYARQLESVGRAYEMGIDISTGTDPGGYPVAPGLGLHVELEHLVRAGIPPIDVLRMATLTAAGAVGAERGLGSIEVGKLADLVLLNADPLEDVRNTRRIWRVIKGGWVLDPAAIMAELTALRERAEHPTETGRE